MDSKDNAAEWYTKSPVNNTVTVLFYNKPRCYGYYSFCSSHCDTVAVTVSDIYTAPLYAIALALFY